MKRLSWKYIAGLIDGEGCIDFQFSYTRKESCHIRPRVRVAMSEPGKSVIELLNNNFGGGAYKRESKNDKWLDSYSWEICGRQSRPFLQNIVNHLIIKKEQAKLVIWWIDNGMGKHVSVEAREHLKQELKAMKRDSQRLSDRAANKIEKLLLVQQEEKPWSKKYDCCVKCNKADSKHHTQGICSKCYQTTRYQLKKVS